MLDHTHMKNSQADSGDISHVAHPEVSLAYIHRQSSLLLTIITSIQIFAIFFPMTIPFAYQYHQSGRKCHVGTNHIQL